MRTASLVLLAALPALAGPSGDPVEAKKPAPAAPATADGRTLREADQALARAVDQRDRAAFEALLAEDAYFLGGPDGLKGRAAVLKGWGRFFVANGPRLRWSPELAEMSRSADLGYTVGRYQLEVSDAAGRNVSRNGRYVTVWRRQPDGSFRAAADAPLLPPADGDPVEASRTPERTLTSRDGDLVVEVGTWRAKDASATSGLYLSVRRRTREGTLAAALETVVPSPPVVAD